MIDEVLRAFVRCTPLLNEQDAHFDEVRLQGVEETAGLKVFGRHADGNAFFFDDIACTVSAFDIP